ncbi:hypothetical protein BATDEDRAFT_25648 [Batrachochytrium dendrobatidis JAM81]|uniref:RIIa domain-containing protein n=2 Tax=Batrachochytrium dendrobatidis TaxID=109871 RepID=F4P4I4_BATDJ|nr:uncharacterized protein BATDEDRAFT_25648 [Batrachochytrium dendrobatidis JAM81]EGF80033.1 hypothetical protein BATDEDRAFT_25648 [Batrachochytrium dendrobatidis JAM81]KAJ8324983.1 hypothetical protein O5D80_006498 [Batrachochytrium dendrobatidis]KAK5672764.1 hypothetical protein QVD99_000262 [Batrachochytrium dendrobatidis]OAJ39085.1 hypothetical protein BDEG_22959 [Batrachochytrium dendrobatidis JEL423]|eukprot:XP_006679496.1 hypothetical protein BATDEDRAFT_25648 [Batrachochytrium dendrobatidis JAM81]
MATASPNLELTNQVVAHATSKKIVLNKEMQTQLDQDKIQLRIENELYIRQHPEIRNIIGYFIQKVLVHRPVNLPEFAVALLANPELKQEVEQFQQETQRPEIKIQYK